MKYQFIEQQKQEFPVVVMCQVLNVSESGLYAWRKRPACQRKGEDAHSAPRFGRSLPLIKADMEARACTPS